ncbi:hypothetical protein [Pseudoalteromonas phenolica]|uniref:hypothetical protein n=1 Tax=Pseudoalteromonas phenolica TaxID=161398 RepID=UPI001F4F789B|nr:hypothetical protein [Pseudoalteromonas phenolica]
MNIKSKVAVPIIIGISLILAASTFSILKLEFLIWDYQSLVNKDQQRIILITNAESSFKSQVQAWKNLLLRNDEKYWQEFLSLHKEVQEDLKQLQIFEEGEWTTQFINQHLSMLEAYEKAQRNFVLNLNYKQSDAMVRGIDRDFAQGLIDKRGAVTKHFIEIQNNIEQQQSIVMTVYPIVSFLIAIVAIAGILVFIHKKNYPTITRLNR